MTEPDSIAVTDLEYAAVSSLLNAVYERYAIDFRNYANKSITRRIQRMMRSENLASIPQLERRLLVDPTCMERLLLAITVNVTSMFRDPEFYVALRKTVLPALNSQGFLRIWHAGCATGEEAFSLAILLDEEGLTGRYRIYATDVNAAVLRQARQGVLPLGVLKEYSRNYIKAGGRRPFSSYYTAQYDHVVLDRALRENIVFSQHNLATDQPFNRFGIVLCRNVMIYFNETLARRVHQLLYDSLVPSGFLCLGNSETIKFTPQESSYRTFDSEQSIYQKLT